MDENRNIDPKMTETLKGIWDSLTDEQKEKAKECKSMDELTALAGKKGVELPDELLDAVAGGGEYLLAGGPVCPYCGSGYVCLGADLNKVKTKRLIGYSCWPNAHFYSYDPATKRYYDVNDNDITPVSRG